jgi:hypothetical protein
MKDKVLFVIAFIAIILTPKINYLAQDLLSYVNLNLGFSLPVTVVSVFTFFGVFYWFFDKFLWKTSLIRRFLHIPYLDGCWDVEGKTALSNGEAASYQWSGKMTIIQSWSKILIHIKASQSESKTITTNITYEENIGYRVLYHYESIPNADQINLAKHSGAGELLFDLECFSAKGHYYTDRHRNTVGVLTIKRCNNNE